MAREQSSKYTGLLLLGWLALAGCRRQVVVRPPQPSSACRAQASELGEATRRSVGYLERATEDSGRFVYVRDLDDHAPSGDYNALRHAGTLYALATAHGRLAQPTTPPVVRRATNWFRQQFVAALPNDGRMLAVWSADEGGAAERREAKLGGAGLGLVALMSAQQLGAAVDRETLVKLGRFVLFMQKNDGTFYSKFRPPERDDSFKSLYYPGEAALGLVMLSERDDDRRWRDGAQRALLALAQARAGQARVPADHWALLATERLLRHDIDSDYRETLVLHSIQVVESILAGRDVASGSLTTDGRTTPTATRLEGLLAAYQVLDDGAHEPLRARIRDAAKSGIDFLLKAQIKQGTHIGAMPRGGSGKHPREVRIDYVQHAISAWLGYWALLDRECR